MQLGRQTGADYTGAGLDSGCVLVCDGRLHQVTSGIRGEDCRQAGRGLKAPERLPWSPSASTDPPRAAEGHPPRPELSQ